MRLTLRSSTRTQLQRLLQQAKAATEDTDAHMTELAVSVARLLWLRARELETKREREQRQRMAKLMADKRGVAFSTLLTDRAFRSQSAVRLASTVGHLISQLGLPRSFGPFGKLQLRTAKLLSPLVPDAVAAGARRRMLADSRHVVVAADDPALSRYLAQRGHDDVRINVNLLGEAVISEAEVERRMTRYLSLLAREDVGTLSVKASSIDCHVDPLAFEQTLARLTERLTRLYEAALAPLDQGKPAKLVTLDMEAYAELPITLALFRNTLSLPQFNDLQAGMVLQAYLPDSHGAQRELTAFAHERVRMGGAPLRLRIVKGANLLMEKVNSQLRGLAVPTYDTKAEVDASFKAMLAWGCRPENAAAVHLGIASHNVFDLALALCLRARHGVEEFVGVELLEGMANPLQRALAELCDDVLIYCPIVSDEDMQSAIAYLLRRLDENSSSENFLRHAFSMEVKGEAFEQQRTRFVAATAAQDEVSHAPRRTPRDLQRAPHYTSLATYQSEPDSDFSLSEERTRVTQALSELSLQVPTLTCSVAGQFLSSGEREAGFDPSRPGHVPYHYTAAGPREIENALQAAERAQSELARMSVRGRALLLERIAQALRSDRPGLIARMVIDAGKRIDQADSEVSEAIDFAEYYRLTFERHAQQEEISFAPRGVTLVTPPWNFPLAIPAGGVLAALMVGNAVILKPALETLWVAHRLVELCYDAGVPQHLLQLVICRDELGSTLVRDPRVRQVILTGGSSTAKRFGQMRPDLRLLAETGGKNALIVGAMADREQAIADALHSAFGHAGQKCSAASLLVCEAEVYDDPHFLAQLREATQSLPVGTAHDPRNIVTPLIAPPSGALLKAIERPRDGGTWLLPPRIDGDNPNLLSPGLLLGPQRGGFMHRTELFGPVLSIMRAQDIFDAIDIANETPYGLTAGLHSLNERDQARFIRRCQAGNLYINRSITGAIVRRQPFGGWKASSFGPGAKAGGSNYVVQLSSLTQREAPPVKAPPHKAAAALLAELKGHLGQGEQGRLSAAACSYAEARSHVFAEPKDRCDILGEHNWHRYVPLSRLLIRLERADGLSDALLACLAALTVGSGHELSMPRSLANAYSFLARAKSVSVAVEESAELRMRLRDVERVRFVGEPSFDLRDEAFGLGVHLDNDPALSSGRFELLRYLKEQSIAVAYHRHGNLSGRWLQRQPPGLD